MLNHSFVFTIFMRISNLPPKSKEEEEAHRKMYEEMVRQYEKKGSYMHMEIIRH